MEKKYTQQVPWGKIEWLIRPEEENRTMSIGITVIKPGKEQVKHMHIGDEQCLITVSGQGKVSINDREVYTQKDDINYFPPYSMHATVNDGNADLVQLMISCPVKTTPTLSKYDMSRILQEHIKGFQLSQEQMEGYIQRYLAEFNTDNFVYTEFPLSFCSKQNETIVPCVIPDVCKEMCKVAETSILCPEAASLMKEKCDSNVNVIECPHGQMVLISEIRCCDSIIGYLQGGYFADTHNLIDTTLYGIIQMLRETNRGISNTCMEQIIQYHTQKQEEQFISEKDKTSVLSMALEESQSRMLRLEIKNHFLFNTLNSIAALSLTAERSEVYQSIVNLSAMFRNQLQKTGTLVTLGAEVEAQKAYMELMKLRFHNEIKIKVSVEDACKTAQIPFNALQPFVENSFVHGFQYEKDKCYQIALICQMEKGNVRITIKDNGIGMPADKLEQLRENLRVFNPHGASMACALLQKEFGHDYSVSITSAEGKGTKFVIAIPYQNK